MRETNERCEHCGRWVRSGDLYTLYGVDHPNCEDVAICERCDEKYSQYSADDEPLVNSSTYWKQWLDERFKTNEAQS